ncbi:MAG: hypothetical protein ACYC63_02145 [Armatimonadota bacterium]
MSEPARQIEPVAGPSLHILRLTILTALLYVAASALVRVPAKLDAFQAALGSCAILVWVFILLFRPVLDLLEGKPAARKELAFGAFLTIVFFVAFALIGIAELIRPGEPGRASLPQALFALVLHAATALVALRLRKEVNLLPE